MVAKLRYYVKIDLLRTVCFAIFDSIVRYGIQAWGQDRSQAVTEIDKISHHPSELLDSKIERNLQIHYLKN